MENDKNDKNEKYETKLEKMNLITASNKYFIIARVAKLKAQKILGNPRKSLKIRKILGNSRKF